MQTLDNRFRLLEELNRGGFGFVHKALDLSTDQPVAVKRLLRLEQLDLELFEREARYLYRARANQNIVKLIWHNLGHNPPYIVLEYCAGGSLRSRVGKLGWRDVSNIVGAAASALHTVHEAGGHHRDVKPDNLLLAGPKNGSWLVKLGDFGLARVPSSRTTSLMTRNACGTEGYMDPALLAGAPFSPACDIYSLGITATELLTGSRDPASIRTKRIPSTLADLLSRMTSLDAMKRPSARLIQSSIDEILAAAERAATAKPVQTQSSSGSGWGWLAAGAAVLGLGLLASAGNGKKWDSKAQRYRGSDGRFTS